MPKLNRKAKGGYYTRVPIENKMATFQIDTEGVKILKTLGYREGENFDINDFWRLWTSDHVYTMGHETLTAECYGEERLIVKPEGPPDLTDPRYGPGWIYDRRNPYIEILFRVGKRFKIIRYIERKYPYLKSSPAPKPKNFLVFDRESLTAKVSGILGNRTVAQKTVDCILESLKEALCARQPLDIDGLGGFVVRVKKKRVIKKQSDEGTELVLEKLKVNVKFYPSNDLIDRSTYKVKFVVSPDLHERLKKGSLDPDNVNYLSHI